VVEKLKSRKLWLAVASALTAALTGHVDQAAQIVLAYLGMQGLVDASAAFRSKP
jgi:hypothetical protein